LKVVSQYNLKGVSRYNLKVVSQNNFGSEGVLIRSEIQAELMLAVLELEKGRTVKSYKMSASLYKVLKGPFKEVTRIVSSVMLVIK
jgi:uncharacterized lipoprotein YajG